MCPNLVVLAPECFGASSIAGHILLASYDNETHKILSKSFDLECTSAEKRGRILG